MAGGGDAEVGVPPFVRGVPFGFDAEIPARDMAGGVELNPKPYTVSVGGAHRVSDGITHFIRHILFTFYIRMHAYTSYFIVITVQFTLFARIVALHSTFTC